MRRTMPIFYSALMLTGVNLLLRLVGTSFQVFLSGRIGAAGIGLLQLVMSVGSMAMTAGIAGIRTATMYLTAEELGRKKAGNVVWVLSGCVLYSVCFSGAVAVALYLFAPKIALHWIGTAQATQAVRLLAVFLPVNCLAAVMTGYFTAAQRIGALAIVEVAEQLLAMTATVICLTFWAGSDPGRACEAVVLGNAAGAMVTLSCLVLLRLRERPQISPRIRVAHRLADTALPLALADDLKAGINTTENLMVPKRLALYRGTQDPLALFGTVCGMVFPVLMFPSAFLFGLTELLIPELAQCNAAGSKKRICYLMHRSLGVALLYGALCSGLLYLIAPELCLLLYGSVQAGEYLRWFAPLAVMLYCDIVTDAMIKGLGQQKVSVRYNIFTSAADVILLFFLLPEFGIKGYFASFLLTHLINFALSLNRLLRVTEQSIPLARPALVFAGTIGAVWAASWVADPVLRVAAFLALFFAGLILLRVVGREDLRWIRGLVQRR